MRKVFCLLCLFFLVGCSKIDDNNLDKYLDLKIKKIEQQQFTLTPNVKKNYFSYYLPREISRYYSDDLNVVFKRNESFFVLNLDPSTIIYNSNNFDLDLVDHQQQIYTKKSQFINYNGKAMDYKLDVYAFDQDYLAVLKTENVTMYGATKINDVVSFCEDMLIISKSLHIYKTTLRNNFEKESIESINENLDLIHQHLPEEGYIKDLISSDNVNPVDE